LEVVRAPAGNVIHRFYALHGSILAIRVYIVHFAARAQQRGRSSLILQAYFLGEFARIGGEEVKHSKLKWRVMILALASVLVLGACKKKTVAPPPPPPPPPPPAPTASLSASPDTIQAGQSTTLTWQTQNATDVTLDGNKVDPNGSRTEKPAQSTTYRLTAKGEGGTQEATARVTVTPPPPPPPQPTATEEELFNQNVKDIFFDYDKYDVRPDQQSTLQADAAWLTQHPNVKFTIEGHCDERGSTEYNLALGDNRANAVKNALVQAGVAADRIRTISYGKEKPFCTESNEACWQQNRRGHLVYQR
jgi:peptidoglycan-associated lipoprotein